MNREQAEKLSKDALDELAAALEGGHSERLTAYLTTMARFHRYSFGNVLLIARQCPEATHVAGFTAWKRMNRFVRKGEKGIGIVAPIVRKVETGDDESAVRGFRVVHVFDIAQTDGEPLPEIRTEMSGDPAGHIALIEQTIVKRGIGLAYADDLDGALGRSKGGAIEILAGLEPATRFRVLAHEFAHEILHRRDVPDARPSRQVRELEAEATSFAVCTGIGLSATECSADYIGLYQGSKELLLASLDRIQKASGEILGELLVEPEASREDEAA